MGDVRWRGEEMLGRRFCRCLLYVLVNVGGKGKEDGLMRRL